MGNLIGRKILQTRLWYEENVAPMPDLDYDYTYPITVYDAVKRTMEDNSPSLTDEIAAIYRLIAEKQSIVGAGVAGRLMTYTGIRGQIGSTEVVKKIAPETINQSNGKIPTERAVGDALQLKVSQQDFQKHIQNQYLHTSEAEKERWDAMAPLETLESHTRDGSIHITPQERALWNSKADGAIIQNHVYSTNNPHNVTAHQVGAYNRQEIDRMFEELRETFFHYENILWDARSNSASLEDYDATNWNPNFVLKYGATLPDVEDPTATYFALMPASNYSTDETQDCIIYVKLPGLTWQEVGLQSMDPGDMVLQYPEGQMYVWIQGRFIRLFNTTDNEITSGTGGGNGMIWRPVMSEDGELSWVLSSDDTVPETVIIQGYTPIKGVDYFDGKDGFGVPAGGRRNELLAKASDETDDTTWKDFYQVLLDFKNDSGKMPEGIVMWDAITDRPKAYDTLGDAEDGFVIQKVITEQLRGINENVQKVKDIIEGLGDVEGFQSNLHEHLNDYMNPHRVTASQIGAVSTATFVQHSTNFNNPHIVTAEQLGLGKVNNTSDLEKPISTQTQEALDELQKMIEALGNPDTNPELVNYVSDIEWDESNRMIRFLFRNGTVLEVELPEGGTTSPDVPIFTQIRFDHTSKDIVITDEDGKEDRISVVDLMRPYTGSLGDQIDVHIDADDSIRATIKAHSITGDELKEDIHLPGNPTADTQDVTENSTRIANTEWVRSQVIDNLISYETDRPLSANMGRILNERKADIVDILRLIEDLEDIQIIDNLESTNTVAALSANMGRYLDITKAPRVHTSPSGSTFGQATSDVFGHVKTGNTVPLMDGTPSPGTDDGIVSRADHRHPTDITRAPLHFPDEIHKQYSFTGEPRSTLPPDDSNDDRIATTEWVRRNAVGVSMGWCYSLGEESIKVATLRSDFMADPVFLRQTGSTVVINFKETDISKGITQLDVHNTGAAPVLFEGQPVEANMISANYDHIFTFDGAAWNLLNPAAQSELPADDNSNRFATTEWVNNNMNGVVACTCTTGGLYSNKIATPITAGTTAPPFVLKVGSAVAVTFLEKDISTTAYPTKLNVDGTGLKTIIFAGAPLLDGLIGAKYTHVFVFDGTYWRLINPADTNSVWDEGGITIGPGGTTPPGGGGGGGGGTPGEDDPGDGGGGGGSTTPVIDHTVVNAMSGYMGYTTQGDGTVDSSGYVSRCWFMISFDHRDYDLEASVSEEVGAFGVKVGNGTIIVLKDPMVISITRDSLVLQFTMEQTYPSNSPCHLVYRTKAAWINIKQEGADDGTTL